VAAVLVALFERERRGVRKAAIVALLGITVIVGGFFALRDSSFVRGSEVLGRLASISIEGGSTRFTVWKMALAGAKERPLLGWGQENFNYVFNTYYEPSLYGQEPWFDRVHNVLLDWLVAGGVLGLLAYLALFFTSLWSLWGPRSSFPVTERALFTGMLAGYLFHNLFVFDNVVSYAVFTSFLAYFHFRSARRSICSEAPVLSGSVLERVAVPAALIVTLFTVYAVNVPNVRAAQDLLQSISPQAGGIPKNLDLFKSALAHNSFANQEIREQLVQAATRVGAVNVDIALKQEFFTLAHDEMGKQIKESPNDARHYLFTGSLLTSFRQFDASLPYFMKARDLSPRKPSMLLALGSVYLAKGDRDTALSLFKESFELEPRYSESRIAYASGLIYAGRLAEADALLMEGFGTLNINSEQIIRTYFDAALFKRVVAIWQGRVEQNPTDPQMRVSLAAAQLSLGNRAAAVAELEHAIELSAAFKEQGEFLIREIKAGRNP
jgi:tetratricopeptide (TPR) repeat protein